MSKRIMKITAMLLACLLLLSACGSSAPEATQPAEEDFNSASSFAELTQKAITGGSQTTPTAPANTGSNGETVASTMDLEAEYAVPVNAVPDLHYWSCEAAEYRDEPKELDGNQVIYYTTEMEWIQKYVSMLQQNGYTLVDKYEGYKGGCYSWAFTCNAVPNARKFNDIFTETPCHVSIYWTDNNRYKFTMNVSPDLEVCDTGARYDGSVVDVKPQGESAGAGLVRLSDGSYQTSDGRLTAAVGTAMVIRDGTAYNTAARYALDGSSQQIWVEGYYRNEGLFIETPENYLVQGDLFRHYDLRRDNLNELDKGSLDGFNYGGVVTFVACGDKWVNPSYNDPYYDALTMRLMYYDKGGDAVFYVYARFKSGNEPQEVEALCAVDTETNTGTINDATYLKAGNTITLKYTHREFDTSYNVFNWEIIEGADKVSISHVGDTCDVTAKSPGVATVRVTYEYSKEEPDVLTGIPRTVGHSIQEEYHFIIE